MGPATVKSGSPPGALTHPLGATPTVAIRKADEQELIPTDNESPVAASSFFLTETWYHRRMHLKRTFAAVALFCASFGLMMETTSVQAQERVSPDKQSS